MVLAACLVACLVAGALGGRALAQDGGPPAADPAPEGAPPPKPKPKPRAKPKPEPKVEPKPDPNAEAKPPEAEKAVKSKSDGTLLEPAPSGTASAWPNGASALSETYGNWTVNCSRDGDTTDCLVIQSQGDQRSGKRLFSIELHPPADGVSEGLILMPFGLQIEPGVTFKLDDEALGKGAPFSYCIADGCLVPISLPTLATDRMKTAQNLIVSATRKNATEPATVTLPLGGFAAAFARAAVLEQ